MENGLLSGKNALTAYKTAIDDEMSRLIASDDERFGRIVEAMRYSALGGKRLRGVMTMAFAVMFGAKYEAALKLACAIECVQAYSLIHDDLPCMDDDDIRRGKPSCHRAFDEATAVLAGDALLTYAFELAAKADDCEPQNRCDAIAALAEYAGFRGMVGGQELDLAAAEAIVSPDRLDTIQKLKTAALFRACAAIGCSAAGALAQDRRDADAFAGSFGTAFQIADDISDSTTGKKPELNSYVSVNGMERALADEQKYVQRAGSALSAIANRGFSTETLAAALDMLTVKN